MSFLKVFISSLVLAALVASMPLPININIPLPRDAPLSITTIHTYPGALTPYPGVGKIVSLSMIQTLKDPVRESAWGDQAQGLLPTKLAHPTTHYNIFYHHFAQSPMPQEQESYAMVAIVAVFFVAMALFELCTRYHGSKSLAGISPHYDRVYLPGKMEEPDAYMVQPVFESGLMRSTKRNI